MIHILDINKYIPWIWFSRIPLKLSKKKELLKKYSILELYESSIKGKEIIKKQNVLQDKKYIKDLDKHIEYMNKNKIGILTIEDKSYPDYLRRIYDAPISLYYKGNIKCLNKCKIAVIGTRTPSQYGKITSRKIAYELSKKNIVIVSGLARGIDSYAHFGAIENENIKMSTIAVVGNGLDLVYPKENVKLTNKILEKDGLILSEYPLGSKPERMHFPERNRIISGLSCGVLVVEARKRSGTFITVDFALDQGKNVYAIPGDITNPLSEGSNLLIKQGAKPVTSYEDIIEDLYLDMK